MDIPKAKVSEIVTASVTRASDSDMSCRFGGVFTITCVDKDNQVRWEESFHNLVVNVGLADLNNKYFTGSSYSAAWYIGLVSGPGASNTYLAADTMSSHGGWTEYTDYSGDRKLVTFGAATTADPSVISNSGSPSVFTISGAGGTVAGAFLTTIETKATTTGTLFSVGNFTVGDKLVTSGDTLNVTYTFSADAA